MKLGKRKQKRLKAIEFGIDKIPHIQSKSQHTWDHIDSLDLCHFESKESLLLQLEINFPQYFTKPKGE